MCFLFFHLRVMMSIILNNILSIYRYKIIQKRRVCCCNLFDILISIRASVDCLLFDIMNLVIAGMIGVPLFDRMCLSHWKVRFLTRNLVNDNLYRVTVVPLFESKHSLFASISFLTTVTDYCDVHFVLDQHVQNQSVCHLLLLLFDYGYGLL